MHNVISLFTGIGGMDMGFGGEVVVHERSVEDEEFIRKRRHNNFVELKRQPFQVKFQNDILKGAKEVCDANGTACDTYKTESICELLNEGYEFPEADVVIGGFPCQDFSHCGKRRGTSSDRGSLYKSFVQVVERVRPKMFVAENVYGLLTMDGNPIEQIIEEFCRIGYDVKYQLIDCSEFGIPQKRKRVIIMGKSNKVQWGDMPVEWNVITKNKVQCNIGRYFEHLREPWDTGDISQQLYSKAKRREKGQGQTEIDLESFAPTMRAEHHGNIEFRRYANSVLNERENDLPERRLTIREAGLIQTFPPDYEFTHSRTMKSYKYIGNAVPPLLGYLVADKVMCILGFLK